VVGGGSVHRNLTPSPFPTGKGNLSRDDPRSFGEPCPYRSSSLTSNNPIIFHRQIIFHFPTVDPSPCSLAREQTPPSGRPVPMIFRERGLGGRSLTMLVISGARKIRIPIDHGISSCTSSSKKVNDIVL
jgi:hypothetical protein